MDPQKAYQQFKLQWMIDHGYTLDDLMEELQETLGVGNVKETFEVFESKCGFHGELYPCFEEFMDCEYHECGYADKEDYL